VREVRVASEPEARAPCILAGAAGPKVIRPTLDAPSGRGRGAVEAPWCMTCYAGRSRRGRTASSAEEGSIISVDGLGDDVAAIGRL
jgi:hypothetical protein